MKYLHYPFKGKRKEVINVHLDQPARVLLMTTRNYNHYRKSRKYAFRGGYFENTPVRFILNAEGDWHLIIERGAYFSPKNINVRIERA